MARFLSTQRSTTWIVVTGVLAGWVGFAISIVTGFIQTRVLLRYLSDTQAGVWFVVLSFLGYLALLDFGAGVTLARYIAFALGGKFPAGWDLGGLPPGYEQQHGVIADLVLTVSRFYLIVGLAAGVLSILVGIIFLPSITGLPFASELAWTWIIATLAGCLILANTAPSATLLGSNTLHYQQAIAAVARLIGLALNVLFLSLGGGLIGVALALLLQNVFTLFANWQAVFYVHPFLKNLHRGRAQLALVRQMMGPSLRMGIVSLANAVALQTDNLVISLRMGPLAVTNYSITFQLAYLLHSLALVISGPFVALSAHAHAEKSPERLRELLGINLRFGMAFMLAGGTLLALYGKEIVELWVGEGRFVGYPVMLLIIVTLVLQVHTIIHFRVITATDRIPFVPWAVGAGALNLIVSLILVGRWGWLGVILATLISQGLTNFWFIPYYTHRFLNVPFTKYWAWIKPALGLGVCIASLGVGIRYLLLASVKLPGLAWRLSLGGVATSLLAVVFFFFFNLRREERALFTAHFRDRFLQLKKSTAYVRPPDDEPHPKTSLE